MQKFVFLCNKVIAGKKSSFFFFFFFVIHFIAKAQSPGGVSTNLQLWLKADAGTSTVINNDPVLNWVDQSANSFSFTPDYRNGADNPLFLANSVNFNPGVLYSGTAMHGLSPATGPLLINSTVFIAGKAGIAAFDTYNAAWTSFSATGNKIVYPYLNMNQPGAYDSVAHAEDYTPLLTWNANEVSFTRGRIAASTDIMYSKQGSAEQTVPGFFTPDATTNTYSLLGNNQRDGLDEPFGIIAETLVYDNASLSSTDVQKIQSYLALKYGASLDQTTALDYLASDGTTVMWNAGAASPGFNQGIFGIGKDAASGLDQRIAQSGAADGIITLSTTNDFLSANNDASRISLSDLNFVTIASNNGAAAWSNSGTLPGYSFLRKQWQAQVTGSGVILYLQVNTDSPGFDVPPSFNGSYYLVTDPDGNGDYSDGLVIPLTNTSGSLWTTSINLSSGTKFTLATQGSPAPGGVVSNLELWLKADAGTSTVTDGDVASIWADNNGWKVNAIGAPLYSLNSINYNPSVFFGTGDYDTIAPFLTISNSSVFLAGVPRTVSGDTRLAWTSYDQAEFPLRITANSVGHYGNGGFNDALQAWNDDEPSFSREHISSSNDVSISKAGSAESVLPAAAFGTSTYYNLGNDVNDFEGFGNIAETFIYNTATLAAADIQKIETYLALKYGVTLNNNAGGSAGNYVLSNNAVAWEAADHPSWHTQVTGIVRDDASALLQKQSHTADDKFRVFVDNLAGDNTSNAGSISNNLSSIIIGNNGDILKASGGVKPTGIVAMFGRSWKITNTNFNDRFSIEIKWDSVGEFHIEDIRLLVSSSPDFAGATIVNSPEVSFSLGSIIVSGIGTGTIPMNATSYFTIGSASPTTLLPVGITDFNATLVDNNHVALQWQTHSEINNDYFTVQKSTDLNNWSDVTRVKGAGTASIAHRYAVTDNSPARGISYYRLKQTDLDGKTAYSTIKTVNITANAIISIFPNPASGLITITGNASELRGVKVCNIAGLDITGLTKLVEQGGTRLVIDISRLSKGIYLIKTNTTANKILKQ